MSAVVSRCGTVPVNGTELYYEVRGQGTPVLCVSGGFGDGAAWEAVADLLADEHRVISYDRRGHSRSPRPADWTSTSMDEQAADAAGLLAALETGPAVVYAHSLGGGIGLTLALRRPELVRLVLLHEPFLPSLLADPAGASAPTRAVVGPFVAAGDLRGGADALLRLLQADAYEDLPAEQRERLLGNAGTLFGVDSRDLGELTVPVTDPAVPLWILRGEHSPDFLTVGAHALAGALDREPWTLPGAHVPHLTHPAAVADTIRRAVREADRSAAAQG
ncbi:alpha/beta fold hydrolase [Streptacidiphilus sp. P02-A3a]|uniref:alpha/beta fold hydrolase n=1 Tax=Streptacidiphilus sp. P02-A3a TaxID=2704468 RepID=UPI0015F81BA3|nr:alpha/beta hydrolase [Streptacidiphilus sp. P02-A3a]QMU71238.1 alpha/beta hydrolase [Streptacidiphilus sp. P02-A3a]